MERLVNIETLNQWVWLVVGLLLIIWLIVGLVRH